jgi:hypothetical protein
LGAGRRPGAASRDPEHFGRRRVGPPKIVALAAGAAAGEKAARWLDGLRSRGADVALVCEGEGWGVNIPRQTVRRLGPLAVIRALETEMHVRPIDAVVPVGARARLILRAVPASLRPRINGLSVDQEPASVQLDGSGPDAP